MNTCAPVHTPGITVKGQSCHRQCWGRGGRWHSCHGKELNVERPHDPGSPPYEMPQGHQEHMPAKNLYIGWVPVAHACNPSYSGDRDQEDRGSKPAGQTVLKTLCLKNPSQKRAGGVAQGVAPEFKPQYRKNKTKTCTQMS
jgi:hypothetical protein